MCSTEVILQYSQQFTIFEGNASQMSDSSSRTNLILKLTWIAIKKWLGNNLPWGECKIWTEHEQLIDSLLSSVFVVFGVSSYQYDSSMTNTDSHNDLICVSSSSIYDLWMPILDLSQIDLCSTWKQPKQSLLLKQLNTIDMSMTEGRIRTNNEGLWYQCKIGRTHQLTAIFPQ